MLIYYLVTLSKKKKLEETRSLRAHTHIVAAQQHIMRCSSSSRRRGKAEAGLIDYHTPGDDGDGSDGERLAGHEQAIDDTRREQGGRTTAKR